MDWLWQTVIIVGMFILRLGAPLAITLAVGYWLRRLDAKWQAEATAWQATDLAQREIEVEPALEIEMARVIEPPCWVIKECPQSLYAQCPAYRFPDLPCWMARYRVDNCLPAKCYTCELFSPRQKVLQPVPQSSLEN